MSRRKTARQLRNEMLQLCGEIHDDDGIDPREFFKSQTRSNKPNHKALQLCGQVTQTLHLVLNDCDDPVVQSMDVTMVIPNPDTSCLRIHLACNADCGLDHPNSAITQQTNRLRNEISKSIHRKRVPNLVFSVAMIGVGVSDEPQ